ncbi:MAG: endonuclease [Candidatus Thiodiazotropha sp. L084R]
MNRLLAVSGLALALNGNTIAEVSNGDFEEWGSGVPLSWSLIDSSISVSQSNNISKEGSSSARVSVNTTIQSATDFRQSVAVTAGEPYDFGVWVYHTDGGVKARLYVDGYRGYSDESLVNQWQRIVFTYTAQVTGTIEAGLRFYDVGGFDGSEVVYVDDFQPTAGNTTGSGGCPNTQVTMTLNTDSYGSETSWQLTDSQSQTFYSANTLESNTTYTETFCLPDNSYTFTIVDSYGDGICCQYGQGSYSIESGGNILVIGGDFISSEVSNLIIGDTAGGVTNLNEYYISAEGTTGYELKTALYNIINNHVSQGYSALWNFYYDHALDHYYEDDGSILDIYSENPTSIDSYNYHKTADQCGTYNSEGDCYNREHSFPRSWFGGTRYPMNSDIHHIFASDGYVNAKRGSFPYGEVGSASFISSNGSKLGSAIEGLGYSGTVFEPIDEFKGDIARAYFYMATRYENVIGSWENNSAYSNAALNGTGDQVFESWFLDMLLQWHSQDPISQKEIDRNEAVYQFQGNRNPFVDHPEFAGEIWK